MLCHSCRSTSVRDYPAEINVHFPGMRGLNIPSVWVFPRLSVCIACGATEFTLTDADRKALTDRDWRVRADDGAASHCDSGQMR